MTAKSSLRSMTVFRLRAQSNKCESRQTTRRLGGTRPIMALGREQRETALPS